MDLLVKCPVHPNRFVTYVYTKNDIALPSRLICGKCLSEKKENFDDILDFADFMEDPLNMFSVSKRKIGLFHELNLYFKRAQKDPMTIIDEYQQKINQQIEQLRKDLFMEIQEFRNFQNQIKQAKTQFIEVVNHKNLKEAFQKLIQIDNYHSKKEWTQLQDQIQEYIQQFINQDSNELKEALYKLKNKDKDYFQGQAFTNFVKQTQAHYAELVNEFKSFCVSSCSLYNIESMSEIDTNFVQQLSQQIDPNLKFQTKQLFKGSEHGMNANSFWSKCQNQGPTLTICKSANGTVFGGYTPCKWVANGTYTQDATLKSFLFNANRKEIYQNFNQGYSIYGTANWGPQFGGGADMRIEGDFKTGHSNLGFSYQLEHQDKIQNFDKATHLMGDTTPNLVEMEVYLIEPIK